MGFFPASRSVKFTTNPIRFWNLILDHTRCMTTLHCVLLFFPPSTNTRAGARHDYLMSSFCVLYVFFWQRNLILANTRSKVTLHRVSWRIPAFLDADYVPRYMSRHTLCCAFKKKTRLLTHPGFFLV